MGLSVLFNGVDVTEYIAPQGLTRTTRKVANSVTTMDGTEVLGYVATKTDWGFQFKILTTDEMAIIANALGNDAYFNATIVDPVNGVTFYNLKVLNRPVSYLTPAGGIDYWLPQKLECTEL